MPAPNGAVLAIAGLLLPVAAQAADVPGNATTKATVPIAPTLTQGTFETKGDHDWYKVVLEKGKDYALAITSPAKQHEMTLTLRGSDGRRRAETRTYADYDDGYEAAIEFRPEATGTFFLDAGQTGGKLGSYGLRATADCRHDPTTQCVAVVGQTQSRLLTGSYEADWYKVTLDAAKTYTVVIDPATTVFAKISDSSDNGFKYDFSPEPPAKPTLTLGGFKPPRTGDYYIDVENRADQGGLYKLTVKAGS